MKPYIHYENIENFTSMRIARNWWTKCGAHFTDQIDPLNRLTSNWDRVTCPHCLERKDLWTYHERQKQALEERVGWWAVETVTQTDGIPTGEVRYVYGSKPPETITTEVSVATPEEVIERVEALEREVRQIRDETRKAWAMQLMEK